MTLARQTNRMIERAKRLVGAIDRWSMRHRWPRISRRAIGGFFAHEALQYAGSMAYFGMLSIVQLLVLGIVVASFFLGEEAARDFVVDQVRAGTPIDTETIDGVIESALESRGTITIISFGFLLWGALGIFSAMSGGISRAFDNAPPRPFIKERLIGLLLMAVTGLLAASSLIIGIVTGILQQATGDVLSSVPGRGSAVWLIGLLLPIILIFLAFWVIYRVVPNRRVTWGEVLPGAVLAALLWTVLRFGFTWYATSVADYQSAYGPISTAITLLVFLYFASVIVLVGAEFARATAVEDEIGPITAADPRFLPVPTGPALGSPAAPRKGISRWIVLGAGVVIGLVAGRLSKGSGDE